MFFHHSFKIRFSRVYPLGQFHPIHRLLLRRSYLLAFSKSFYSCMHFTSDSTSPSARTVRICSPSFNVDAERTTFPSESCVNEYPLSSTFNGPIASNFAWRESNFANVLVMYDAQAEPNEACVVNNFLCLPCNNAWGLFATSCSALELTINLQTWTCFENSKLNF